MQWKELLGNRNVDERVYDVLGELLTSVILLHTAKTQNGTVLLELHMTLIAMESSMKSNPQQQGISEKLL